MSRLACRTFLKIVKSSSCLSIGLILRGFEKVMPAVFLYPMPGGARWVLEPNAYALKLSTNAGGAIRGFSRPFGTPDGGQMTDAR
jgi:hypothetical protein